jgi:hypothetical protein
VRPSLRPYGCWTHSHCIPSPVRPVVRRRRDGVNVTAVPFASQSLTVLSLERSGSPDADASRFPLGEKVNEYQVGG